MSELPPSPLDCQIVPVRRLVVISEQSVWGGANSSRWSARRGCMAPCCACAAAWCRWLGFYTSERHAARKSTRVPSLTLSQYLNR